MELQIKVLERLLQLICLIYWVISTQASPWIFSIFIIQLCKQLLLLLENSKVTTTNYSSSFQNQLKVKPYHLLYLWTPRSYNSSNNNKCKLKISQTNTNNSSNCQNNKFYRIFGKTRWMSFTTLMSTPLTERM